MKKTTFFRSVSPRQANIKKIIQTDENIGKLSSSTPALVTAAAEFFVKTLVTRAASRASPRLTPETLSEVLATDRDFAGLASVVEALSGEEPRKVQKTEVDDTEEEEDSD